MSMIIVFVVFVLVIVKKFGGIGCVWEFGIFVVLIFVVVVVIVKNLNFFFSVDGWCDFLFMLLILMFVVVG